MTSILAFSWFIVLRRLEMYELSYYIASTIGLFLFASFIVKEHFLLSRLILISALNLSVLVTASYIGQAGSVEFILLFTFGLPFLMFSFLREKKWVFIFGAIPLLGWMGLFFSDFKLFSSTELDPVFAHEVIYPFSVASTFVLVGFEIIYFACMISRYNVSVHNKRREAEQASTAKTRFLSTMSHEIRTPLNAIIGISHILELGKPREDQKENVKALNYSAKLLMELLNNVLDYSKIDAQKLQLDPVPTNLNKELFQLQKIHQAACENKGIKLVVDIDEDIPMIWLDEVRFTQVINNLLTNAIKFTDQGEVLVKLKTTEITEDTVDVRVEVLDTGIGIAEDKLDAVFEAFRQETNSTQRLYGGTGLGLSIVQKIVEQMGSEVKVDSKLGEGTKFYFDLQLDRVKDAEQADDIGVEQFNLQGVNVLLVEDNPINEMVGRQILENAGISVESAEDGEIAVSMAQKKQYDIILMDIQMPIMDGYQASIAIREFDQSTPIIALSASVLMEVKDQIYDCGMNGFVHKPFNPDRLFEEIHNLLKAKKDTVIQDSGS